MFDTVAVADVPPTDQPPGEVLEPVHPWSSYAPDGLLATLLDHQAGAEGGFEQLERIAAWDKIESWAQAMKLRELASFAEREVAAAQVEAADRAARRAAGQRVASEVAYCNGLEQAGAQLAMALRISVGAADRRVADALTLTGRHPAVLDALEAGALTWTKVRIVLEQTEQLSDAQAAAVTRRVLGRAAEQTPVALRAAVRRAVARADPDAVRRRQAAAVADRGVSLYDLPDGMAVLSARLPAPEAVGAWAVLGHHARSAQGPDDPRTLDARRADALIDLVCGTLGSAARSTGSTGSAGSAGTGPGERGSGRGPGAAWRERVQVRVTVPFTSLFGLDEQPGELAGYGPITPDQARLLAGAGTWRRVLTDPATGLPVDFGTTRYRPPPALRDAVLTRNPQCQAPGCTRPATGCDLDHHTPHRHTGTTTLRDTGPYCRRHHRLKQTPRWRVTRHPDGSTSWTTPSRHTYRSTPPPVAEPAAPPPPDPDAPPPF